VLPVEFERSFEKLAELLASVDHDAVVSFGLADDGALRLERTARNRNGASVADAAGVVAAGAIVPDAPETIASRLPLESIALRLASSDVPHRFSDDAGDYVCNNLFFRLLYEHTVDTKPRGLVHVPPLERWPARRLVDAAALVIGVVAEAVMDPSSAE
jgi:pyroglutamyl-peptidase